MTSHLSQEFIQKQKSRLEEMQKQIELDVKMLHEDDPFSDPEHTNDNAAVDSDVRDQSGHQTIQAQIDELEHQAKDIKIALQKIQKGTYGVCEKTNQPIPQARLELVPEARFLADPS